MTMTKEQQDKLRRALYNAKFTTDVEDEDPFVGIYFNDLLDIIHDFGQQHPNWIPVEEELPKEEGRYWCCDDDGGQEELRWRSGHWYGLLDPYPIEGITHWMPLPQPPQGKEE